MGDKRTIVFPSLLFVIFLVLLIVAGFFQIRIIRGNIERQLTGEAQVVFAHVQREIDINLEYLNYLDSSPAILTPYFFNVMVYDEAIIEDLYSVTGQARGAAQGTGLSVLSQFDNVVEYDLAGNVLARKGRVDVPALALRVLIDGRQETTVKTPSQNDGTLMFGRRVDDRIFFINIGKEELEGLRKKAVLSDVVEREEKRFSVSGIKIYDGEGSLFVGTTDEKAETFMLSRNLNSSFLPGFRMEILVSRGLASDTIRRTTLSFILILSALALSGMVSIYAIFLMERKHGKKVKEMEREMEVKQRLVSLGKLASGMAHEIRNPLNAIGLSVQRLKREFAPDEQKRPEYFSFLDIIRKELTRVNGIVEEFLQSTRARVPFGKESLRDIIEEVVIIVGEKASSKDIFIENTVSPDIIVECQKDRIKQALYNIILNGIESMDTGGKIEIAAKKKGATVEASIKDSGCGMSEATLTKIFEYYYTTKDKGMGLGLPISYMIVKDHGGDIRVARSGGQGTIFTVLLPLVQPERTKDKAKHAEQRG